MSPYRMAGIRARNYPPVPKDEPLAFRWHLWWARRWLWLDEWWYERRHSRDHADHPTNPDRRPT